jgi:hypothetical protein
MPGTIAGYYGNVGIGTRRPERMLHVKHQCTSKNDAECVDRSGQIMLAASWRNVLMSRIKNINYDIIGSYANWAQGKSVIYIGAHDSQARPSTSPIQRVFFGRTLAGEVMPRVRVEMLNGKFYAKKFVKIMPKKAAAEIEENADMFLDVENGTPVDVADMSLALHAKTRHHAKALAHLTSEADRLIEQAKQLKLRLLQK